MITPLSQPPLPVPGAPPEQRESGDGFEQLLAAMRPVPLPGPPPLPDHGPATVAVIDILAAEIADPAQPGTEEHGPVPVAAERFNEHGFMGTATADEAAPVAAEPPAPAPTATRQTPMTTHRRMDAPVTAEAPEPSQPEGSFLPQSAPIPAGPIADAPAAVPEAQPASALTHIATRSAGAPLAPRTAIAARITRTVTQETARPRPPRPPIRWPEPRAVVQVVVTELEQGLHVAARAALLDEGERLRLHDEIAALLARHGRPARTIRIHAPLPPSEEKAR